MDIRSWVESRYGWLVYRALAAVAGVAVLVAITADIAMWMLLPDYNPVNNTISNAAAGRHAWVLDGALVFLAFGVAALAIGFVLRGGDNWRSYAARIGLIVLSASLLPIALYNGYGESAPGGMRLHKLLTALGYFAIPVILWFAPAAPPRAPANEVWTTRGLAVAFLVFGLLFPMAPDGVQGLSERALAAMALAAIAAAAWELYRRPQRF